MQKITNILLILVSLLCIRIASYAQNSTIDSIKKQLSQTEIPSEEVGFLNDLAYEYRNTNAAMAISYAQQALDLSKSIAYNKGIINSYANLGLIYQYKGEYAESLSSFQEALALLDASPDNYILAKIYNNIGNLYWRTNESKLAYDYYKKALEIREDLNDSLGLAKVLGNLGNTAKLIQHNTDSSFYYYSRAFDIFKAMGDSSGLSTSFSNLANIYKERNQSDKAIAYYNKSLEIDLLQNNSYGVTFDYSNLGNIHNDLGHLDSAIYYYDKLLTLSEKINSLPRKRQAYLRLYGLYESLENYKRAFQYLKLYKQTNDSLINQHTKNRMADIQLQLENQINEKELDLLRTKSEKNSIELSKRYWQMLFLILLLIGVVAFAIALWLRFKTKNKLYKKLREQSDELSEAQLVIEERNHELVSINENLEQKVGDRTQELNNAYQNLLISNQRLDHFTYRSAHDLKGPIASILGLVNLLKVELDNDEALNYVNLLNDTALKMDKLLKRIVSSHQIHQKLVIKRTFDVSEVIDQIKETIKVNDSNKKIKVSCVLNGANQINSDPAILLIIMRYLVYNSIQYINSHQVENKIIIQTESSEIGFYQIHILDNGIGIDPALIPDLFKMFSKGATEARNPGLGLYDANLLAEKIGGEVYFDDTDEHYTHFVISFPSKI